MKKLFCTLLILTFVLVPVGSILACTTPATTTVKIIGPVKSAAPYSYHVSKTSGSIKLIQKRITSNNTKKSQPVIKINGVPLRSEYIQKILKTPEKPVVPSKPKTPVKVPVPKPTPKPEPAPVPQPNPNPQPAPSPEPDPGFTETSMQSEMLGYMNAERVKANLVPLELDQKLCQGALLKSKDMAVNNYFSHTSPTYGSPFDMMKSLGITYRTAGENIAKNTSVKGAHDAFMNSSGHRANILNAGFNKVGLGFYQDGSYLYVTQWFSN